MLKYRLESEYGAECRVENAPWTVARWIRPREGTEAAELTLPSGAAEARDAEGAPVALFSSQWSFGYFETKNPDLEISALPFR